MSAFGPDEKVFWIQLAGRLLLDAPATYERRLLQNFTVDQIQRLIVRHIHAPNYNEHDFQIEPFYIDIIWALEGLYPRILPHHTARQTQNLPEILVQELMAVEDAQGDERCSVSDLRDIAHALKIEVKDNMKCNSLIQAIRVSLDFTKNHSRFLLQEEWQQIFLRIWSQQREERYAAFADDIYHAPIRMILVTIRDILHLRAAQSTISSTKQDLQDCNNIVERNRTTSHNEFETERRDFRKQISNLDQQIKNLEQRLENATMAYNAQMQSIYETSQASSSNMESVQRENERLKIQLDETSQTLSSNMESLQRENERLKVEKEKLQHVFQEAQQLLQQAQQQSIRQTQERDALLDQLRGSHKARGHLLASQTQWEQSKKTLQHREQELTQECASVQQKCEALLESGNSMQREIQSLLHEREMIDNEMDILRRQVKDKDDEMFRQVQTLREEFEAKDIRLTQLERQFEAEIRKRVAQDTFETVERLKLQNAQNQNAYRVQHEKELANSIETIKEQYIEEIQKLTHQRDQLMSHCKSMARVDEKGNLILFS